MDTSLYTQVSQVFNCSSSSLMKTSGPFLKDRFGGSSVRTPENGGENGRILKLKGDAVWLKQSFA